MAIDEAGAVDEALERMGVDLSSITSSNVAGGCISTGRHIKSLDGRAFFVKRSNSLPTDMFPAEAAGLVAMRAAGALRVPEPLAVNALDAAEGFIVMQWIETGSSNSETARALGRGLARMHRTARGQAFGFSRDNYIGSTPQPNDEAGDWLTFFAEQRLRFQVKLALDSGKMDSALASDIDRIVLRLPELLPNTDHPALLHGDLWGGNYIVDERGDPVLIDPATYYGHREADLAMTRLFGGFPSSFYQAYDDTWSLDPGFGDRADLYNLYHMLNHLNIFGGSYLGSVRSMVRSYR